MTETILFHIAEIERVEEVRIVYACESGSRAWGFPSADSDFDVRFIYLRRPERYLSIDDERDVVERPVNAGLDLSGWDLKKALKLFRKSNPPLLEWLGSPIVYLEKYSVTAKMRLLGARYYSPAACMHHYLHMAQRNFREYLRGEVVWVKKYFYVLRPILAMRWIEEGKGIVPMEFGALVGSVVREAELRREIDRLLEAKRGGAELDRGPRIEAISRYIESELERWERSSIADYQLPAHAEPLDELFRESLKEGWQS